MHIADGDCNGDVLSTSAARTSAHDDDIDMHTHAQPVGTITRSRGHRCSRRRVCRVVRHRKRQAVVAGRERSDVRHRRVPVTIARHSRDEATVGVSRSRASREERAPDLDSAACVMRLPSVPRACHLSDRPCRATRTGRRLRSRSSSESVGEGDSRTGIHPERRARTEDP